MKKILDITILRPAGNDTALIKGIPSDEIVKKKINSAVMKKFPNVEQVGFYEKYSSKEARLEMAGGEFCGNALRSLAYLLLDGKRGEMTFSVSGVFQKLKAGVKNKYTAFANMSVKKTLDCIKNIDGFEVVELEGITHVVMEIESKKSVKETKLETVKILKKLNLLNSVSAAGVMFFIKKGKDLEIYPVVWVRDIQTLYYETACASGTIAVALIISSQLKSSNLKVFVTQPSGEILAAIINQNEKQREVLIEGPIKILNKKTLLLC